MQQYLSTRDEIDEGAKILFEKVGSGKIKIKIYKKYKLENVVEAHKDLQSRKILEDLRKPLGILKDLSWSHLQADSMSL